MCDVDHVDAHWLSVQHRNASATLYWRNAFTRDARSARDRKNASSTPTPGDVPVLVDALHYFLHTLISLREIRYVVTLVPELLNISLEVERRHEAIEALCAGVEQLSFGCVGQVVEGLASASHHRV